MREFLDALTFAAIDLLAALILAVLALQVGCATISHNDILGHDCRVHACPDDNVGNWARWVPPTIANGRVYLPFFTEAGVQDWYPNAIKTSITSSVSYTLNISVAADAGMVVAAFKGLGASAQKRHQVQ